jgi:hypothetical protein
MKAQLLSYLDGMFVDGLLVEGLLVLGADVPAFGVCG